MLLTHGNHAWARKALLAWVSVWMLMLPWVHIHPEVEHNHGDPSHTHHAVTHTLFSPPLECELPAQNHHHTCQNSAHHHAPSLGHPGSALTHPEIEFALAASSATPTIGKIILSLSLLIEDIHAPAISAVSKQAPHRDTPPTLLFLATALPLRAPPTPLS